MHYFGKVWLPARSIVEATLAARREVDPSGEILQLKNFCPWKEHLHELEEEHKVEPKIKYVLYEVRGPNVDLYHLRSNDLPLLLACTVDCIQNEEGTE